MVFNIHMKNGRREEVTGVVFHFIKIQHLEDKYDFNEYTKKIPTKGF